MESRITHSLIQSGEIIKSLNSSSIATLLFVLDDQITYQNEMADRLDCTPAPISTTLQSLGELPIPLVERKRKYQITPAGESVISILDKNVLRLGMDLCNVDWSNDNEKAQLNSLLKPLHNSRSLRPFFVLDALRRSVQNATVDDIVSTVNEHRSEQGKAASRKQIRRTIDRFESNGAVEATDTISLTDHGKKQARMLDEFMDFTEALMDEPSADTATSDGDTANETFIPAYRPANGDDYTIALTSSTTVGELYQQVRKLHNDYDNDDALTLVWMKEKRPITA